MTMIAPTHRHNAQSNGVVRVGLAAGHQEPLVLGFNRRRQRVAQRDHVHHDRLDPVELAGDPSDAVLMGNDRSICGPMSPQQ